jgi:hypothetical protein
MAVLYDYFAAPSDDVAATALEEGPRDQFPTVETKFIEPIVVLGQLEELLTGRPYDEVVKDPRWAAAVVIEHDDSGLMVITVTDGLRDGLAAAGDLAEVAVRWAGIEELAGFDAAVLAEVLDELKALAVDAEKNGERLYCWTCV